MYCRRFPNAADISCKLLIWSTIGRVNDAGFVTKQNICSCVRVTCGIRGPSLAWSEFTSMHLSDVGTRAAAGENYLQDMQSTGAANSELMAQFAMRSYRPVHLARGPACILLLFTSGSLKGQAPLTP
jgi:hypothetical protein